MRVMSAAPTATACYCIYTCIYPLSLARACVCMYDVGCLCVCTPDGHVCECMRVGVHVRPWCVRLWVLCERACHVSRLAIVEDRTPPLSSRPFLYCVRAPWN